MSTDKKPQPQKITSPRGVASYPWLNKADTKYNAAGVFSVNLLVPQADAQGLCDQLDALAEASFKEAVEAAKPQDKKKITKAEPYALDFDKEGEETGLIKFHFKMINNVTPKKGDPFVQTPKLFDAAGKLLDSKVVVYGGSLIKVSFQPIPYFMASAKAAGVSLRMMAVQVIKLISGGGSSDAGEYGFEEEEGYTQETFENSGDNNSNSEQEDF